MRRYLFLCPDRTSASGGIAVIYDLVGFLNKNGYCAAVLHNSPSAGYPDYPNPVPMLYTRRVWQTLWQHSGIRAKLKMLQERVSFNKKLIRPANITSSDIIVVPEFLLAEAIEAFDGMRIVVFVQNPFSLMQSYHRAKERGLDPQSKVNYWLGIAEVCRTHMSVLGMEPCAIFPVSMKPNEFPYIEKKQKLITYMPRKRPWEADLIAEALLKRNQVCGYRVEAIENMTRVEVAAKLAESRIFISLLHQEALGFPAAEAMSSGCIVIGFDGLGTAEYFDNEVGIPVTEGDIASIVKAVENAVTEYEANPNPLDFKRRKAAERVNQMYSREKFEASVSVIWKNLDLII